MLNRKIDDAARLSNSNKFNFMTEFNAKNYWETRLRDNFGLHGVGCIGWGPYYNNWLYKIRRIVFLHLVKFIELDIASADVLDIGSGSGFYIDRWQEVAAKTITGADLTSIAVQELRNKYPSDAFHQIDIGDEVSALRGQQFDIVSCFDVLFHIVDDNKYQKAIENIYSLLKPGGYFAFSDVLLHGETRRYKHVVWRSQREVQNSLQQAGFKVIREHPMFVLMNEPVNSDNRALGFFWRTTKRVIIKFKPAGLLVGGLLFPIERVLVTRLTQTSSTKVFLCRKPLEPDNPLPRQAISR
jgi:2-polyprenyl-3-methyl-5-hydroxy-6-metoxy-1,4-benzoquinol methylase